MDDISGYKWGDTQPVHTQAYLLPKIIEILNEVFKKEDDEKRIFDVGCGNGAFGRELILHGFDVCGVDPSFEGIEQINKIDTHLNFSVGSCYEPLHEKYGEFPVVMSLEVIEHVYAPRQLASCIYSLLKSGGTAIISTPYHGYLKNLFLALTGKMDDHFTALWDNGHIKFWSERTLKNLLIEQGFHNIRFVKAGRLGPLAKSMIAVAKK